MEIYIAVDNVAYLFETHEGTTRLKLTSTTTPSTDTLQEQIRIPALWLVTRRDGVPLFASKPKVGDKPFRILSAESLYGERVQWFEPLADHYREFIWMNPESTTPSSVAGLAFRHLTWTQIIDFSIVERFSVSFASHLSGDWKRSSEGGDSYLMVLVDGDVYWADALGQIPFAVNTYRKYFAEGGSKDSAISQTVKTGIEYGDGNPLIPAADPTNEYDNYMVLRGARWASENFTLEVVHRVVDGFVPRTIEQIRTRYNSFSDIRLRTACDQESLTKYGVWLK